jgi:hypothetical protein
MVKVMQHIIAYFSIVTKDMELLPSIIEVDPKLKGAVFGFGRCDYKTLKTKSVEKAMELLEERDDETSIEIMNFWKSKKDDLADTVIMIEAFCRWRGIKT